LGAQQPARRAFEIEAVRSDGRWLKIHQTDAWRRPFGALCHFACEARRSASRVLVVPPLSGHFPFLLRDLIIGLLLSCDVFVADWINARYVPATAGDFPADDNTAYIRDMIAAIGPEAHVVALCQGALPALAAAALLSQAGEGAAPRSITLIAAPVDPLANPTPVARALRSRSLAWFERWDLETVGGRYPGAGRRVYPAWLQLAALSSYLARHSMMGDDLAWKVMRDDGVDPAGHPFLDAYSSIMDLDARCFLDIVRLVYQERAAPRGLLTWRGDAVDLGAVEGTALMTVEGERDDICAPGQTSAAHALCPRIPDAKRRRIVLAGAGHFSTFHGDLCRRRVAPLIRSFIREAEA
jgi:poly(3-hydroxybutyrate) depolymerase